jgi:hypothetical protein
VSSSEQQRAASRGNTLDWGIHWGEGGGGGGHGLCHHGIASWLHAVHHLLQLHKGPLVLGWLLLLLLLLLLQV